MMIAIYSIGRFLVWLLIPSAVAQDPCVGVPGGCFAAGNVLVSFIQPLGELMVGVAAGAAVLFVVYGGAQMMLNFGDESKVERGRMSVIYALGGFALVLASQSLVAFVHIQALPVAQSTDPFIDILAAAVRAMLTLFNVTFVIMVMFAGYRMVIGRGQAEEFNKAKTMLIWTAGGALVINVAHALARAVLGLGL